MVDSIARGLSRRLDRATYEGYRLGFEAARDEIALLLERRGEAALVALVRALQPLPDRNARQ